MVVCKQTKYQYYALPVLLGFIIIIMLCLFAHRKSVTDEAYDCHRHHLKIPTFP